MTAKQELRQLLADLRPYGARFDICSANVRLATDLPLPRDIADRLTRLQPVFMDALRLMRTAEDGSNE